MTDGPERFTATAEDLADALALALRFEGRKRVHNADELMSAIVAKRLVEHLKRSGDGERRNEKWGHQATAPPESLVATIQPEGEATRVANEKDGEKAFSSSLRVTSELV